MNQREREMYDLCKTDKERYLYVLTCVKSDLFNAIHFAAKIYGTESTEYRALHYMRDEIQRMINSFVVELD